MPLADTLQRSTIGSADATAHEADPTYRSEDESIGAVVREFRERAGHSQERLSGECGFDRTYISRVERGIINPTVGRLWQIADALETPLSQLAKRMELWIADQVRVPSRRGDAKRS